MSSLVCIPLSTSGILSQVIHTSLLLVAGRSPTELFFPRTNFWHFLDNQIIAQCSYQKNSIWYNRKVKHTHSSASPYVTFRCDFRSMMIPMIHEDFINAICSPTGNSFSPVPTIKSRTPSIQKKNITNAIPSHSPFFSDGPGTIISVESELACADAN